MNLHTKIFSTLITSVLFIASGCAAPEADPQNELDMLNSSTDMATAPDSEQDLASPEDQNNEDCDMIQDMRDGEPSVVSDMADTPPDMTDMQIDMRDTPPDMTDMRRDLDMCALDCACDGVCVDGVVTVNGTGGGWEGVCGEEPECPAPVMYQCPGACAATPPEDVCSAAIMAEERNDLSAFCEPQ